MKKIFSTIGYEDATIDTFIATLKDAGIKALLDVRAVPLSRKPGFSKNKLAGRLAEHNIRYYGLRDLGTPAAGRDAARKGRIGEMQKIFRTHLRTKAAQQALEEAISLVTASKSCLLCFENNPGCCHRLIVAEKIAKQTGFAIEHLNPVLKLI